MESKSPILPSYPQSKCFLLLLFYVLIKREKPGTTRYYLLALIRPKWLPLHLFQSSIENYFKKSIWNKTLKIITLFLFLMVTLDCPIFCQTLLENYGMPATETFICKCTNLLSLKKVESKGYKLGGLERVAECSSPDYFLRKRCIWSATSTTLASLGISTSTIK